MAWFGLSFVAGVIALLCAIRIALGAAPRAEMAELRQINRHSGWGLPELLSLAGPVGQFVQDVQRETNPAVRIDKVAEQISAVDIETWDVEQRVGMWARIALFSGVACSVLILCEGLGRMQRLLPYRLMLPFTIGAMAALGCRWVGRVAGGAAAERRRAWDALSAVLIRPLLPEQFGDRRSRMRASGPKSRCHDDA